MAPSKQEPPQDLEALLKQLCDVPVIAVSDETLTILTNHLIGPSTSTAASISLHNEHWFCSRAEALTREVATFLIRLHAYDSPRVKVWRRHLQECIMKCCACVRGMQEAKVFSRETYFGAFEDSILENFYDSLDNWELESVLAGLSQVHITPDSIGTGAHFLTQAPPAVTYHIFWNPHILRDPRVAKIVRSCIPKSSVSAWPTDYPPPGLLSLVIDEQEDVRKWALQQLSLCKATPMSPERFIPCYNDTVKTVTSAVSKQAVNYDAVSATSSFSRDPVVLWSGYTVILRYIPAEFLRPRKSFDVDLCHIILGHLSDTGNHFLDVLKSFLLILSRIGPGMWEGEGSEYPQVIFNSIKDNIRYLEILQSLPDVRKDTLLLSWVQTYLRSIGAFPICRDILPIIVHFLCEELQHERFQSVRPAAMSIAVKILIAVFTQAEKDHLILQQSLIWEILDVHGSMLVCVSFAKAFVEEAWTEARTLSRKLLKLSLRQDMKNIMPAISYLSGTSSGVSTALVLREQLWQGMYSSVQPGDSDGIAMMLAVLADISHIDELKEAAFVNLVARSKDSEAMRSLLASVNRALGIVRNGFGDAVTRYIDLSMPSVIVDLFHRPDVVKNTTILLLSPVEVIQENAQALAGLAFDVEVRADCFRALLEKVPDATFGGVLQYLEVFNQYAQSVPEACSLSKALARCLTDVIDVLCSRPHGLLLNDQFLAKGVGAEVPAEVPRWWTCMTQALSVIFLKTPKWAIYFENAEMVLWMRDALIFGRDMLAQRRVIESAALAHSQQDQCGRKLSRVGRKMVDDLQAVLLELTRWLRLTDEELLHQSFALLETLLSCFKETQIRPKADALQKLQKHVDDAQKKDAKRPQTRLDSTRLARLQDFISAFDEDNEIQILSHKIPEKRRGPVGGRSTAQGLEKGKISLDDRPSEKSTISSYFSAENQKSLDASTTALPQLSRRPGEISSPKATVPGVAMDHERSSARSVASEATTEADSDDSDDEEGQGLASLSKLQRTPVVKKPAERRQVKMFDLPARTRNPALERMNKREDARRTQLRLKPDISSLHRALLSWNYDHVGPTPPGGPPKLERVPPVFSSAEHFRRVFEPMLMLECWSQLNESKESVLETYDCQVSSRSFVDDWLDLDVSLVGSVQKDWSLTDADVVLLRHPTSKKPILAKVQNYKRTTFGIQATLRCCARGSLPALQTNSTWSLGRVLTLTTLHREYGALVALPYYDLLDSILRAKLNKPTYSDSNEVGRTMARYNVNEPQARAILYSLTVNGFALIQGPPGTGKTSTICDLVNAFLSQRPRAGTQINTGRNAGPTGKVPVKKILICAPSNAAIDEVAYRLKEGISGSGRRGSPPKVVRVGRINTMNVSVKDISLEHLIEQKLNIDPHVTDPKDTGSEMARLRNDLENLKKTRQKKFEEISETHDNTAKSFALEEDIKRLNKGKNALIHQIDKLRDQQKSDSRTLDATRRKFRTEVLHEADVICSTLSGSAYEYLEEYDFELIVIDEAAQAIELSSLIPLKYSCKHCVMVGDPQQLPPTVKSQEASNHGYDQSLFVRLQRQRPDAVHLLSIQYRMHPDISQVPSRLFYNGRLQDGRDMVVKTKRPWHPHEKFGTYRFFNVSQGHEETGSGHSYFNRAEAQVAVALFNRLRREYNSLDFDSKVGVISMYRGQIVEMKRAFERQFGPEISNTVDFNTVDGFQGQEKDIIILSCVRAGPAVQSVGFLRDIRRMNVALTRARSSIFVLGHAATLERSDDIWRDIVADARERNRLINVDVAYFTAPTTGTKPMVSSKAPKTQTKIQPPETMRPSLPNNIVTPRELKSVAHGANPLMPSPTAVSPSVIAAKPIDEKKPKLKRLAPVEEGVASISVGVDSQAQTKVPPKKRPKAGPSLFIPKNKART